MNQAIKTEVAGITTSTVNTEEPIIIAIDHGYGNIKTSNFCFPANVTPINDGLSFTDDILIYDGTSYAVGMGHKEFRADKIMDQDYYLLTLAAIGKELDRRGMTKATIVIGCGAALEFLIRPSAVRPRAGLGIPLGFQPSAAADLGHRAEGELPEIPDAECARGFHL